MALKRLKYEERDKEPRLSKCIFLLSQYMKLGILITKSQQNMQWQYIRIMNVINASNPILEG